MSGPLQTKTCREGRPRAGIERDPPQDAKDRRFSHDFNDLDLSSHLSPIVSPNAAIGLGRNNVLDISFRPTKTPHPPG
jgi:hypothetical protein